MLPGVSRARALLALSGFALAGFAHADSGLYLGVGAGGATVEADTQGLAIPALPNSIDEDDTAFRIFGGYTFDLPFFDLGVEAAWNDFGQPDTGIAGGQLSAEASGYSAFGVATLNAGLIDLFAKGGVVAWELETAFDGASLDDDGTDPAYGIGAAFGIGPLEVRGEYEFFDFSDADVSMLSIGALYRF